MVGSTIGIYEIVSVLGEGGMSDVYLAVNPKMRSHVAIKVLKSEYSKDGNIRKRFLAEARSLYRLSHRNLVKVLDLLDGEDNCAIVMEYIEGVTLKEYRAGKKRISDSELVVLFGQIFEVMQFIHDNKLIHRDIKPSNFMVDATGQIKLLDFGIAKNVDVGSPEYTMTNPDQKMGTPLYMSPEQVRSTNDVTHHTDIYSLGVMMWEMVTGRRPYDANTLSNPEIQVMILKRKLPKTRTSWDTIIEKSTHKDIGDRYETVNDIFSDMNKHISGNDNGKEIRPTKTGKPIPETIVASPKTMVEAKPRVRRTQAQKSSSRPKRKKSYSRANTTAVSKEKAKVEGQGCLYNIVLIALILVTISLIWFYLPSHRSSSKWYLSIYSKIVYTFVGFLVSAIVAAFFEKSED